jgi:hypothetical protein
LYSSFFVADPYLNGKFLIIFTNLPLFDLIRPKRPDSFGSLRSIRQKYFSFYLPVSFALRPGLLLALGSFPCMGEPDGGFVELGLAAVDGVPAL